MKSIKITNFQAHKKLEIEFDPLVTTIVGPSDVGKSSILRAIKWICTNRPSGDEFIRHKAKRTSVHLNTGTSEISRSKGDGENTYALDGMISKAFGQTVPVTIAEHLNVSPVNFQGQHDSPFWFMLSPGEVSQELNQIVNLSLIDETLASIASKLRRDKAEAEVTRDRLKTAKDKRNQLRWTQDSHAQLKCLEEDEVELTSIQNRKERLQGLVEEMEVMHQKRTRFQNLGGFFKPVGRFWERVGEVQADRVRLTSLFEQIKTQETKTWQSKETATQAAKELKDKMIGLCPICGNSL